MPWLENQCCHVLVRAVRGIGLASKEVPHGLLMAQTGFEEEEAPESGYLGAATGPVDAMSGPTIRLSGKRGSNDRRIDDRPT
jgi:hypothetical protein